MGVTKVLRLHDDATLPQYGYPGDAGMDLAVVGDHTLNPGESRDLPTGIAIEAPPGHWGRITGRSSTLRKRGLFVNEGVIDEGYRGELLVYVTNRQSTAVQIESGERLAQLILARVEQYPAQWSESLSPSSRGTSGFGSTGTRQILRDPSPVSDEKVLTHIAEALGRADNGLRSKPFEVYLGGPVDYTNDPDGWRHDEPWNAFDTYCPVCECRKLESPRHVVEQNEAALLNAKVAVFRLDAFSVGTPVEAWLRAKSGKPMVIVTGGMARGMYVRLWQYGGAEVVDSFEDAAAAVQEILYGASV